MSAPTGATDQRPTSGGETIDELYRAACQGQRRPLGRLLTMVERGGPAADEISGLVNADSGRAHVLGITGPPGAGKSTLVGQLVALLAAAGRRPAVLAVDPSSPLTGGAILGDRIRMDEVVDPATGHSGAFVRSMATRGHSGGLAVAVPLAAKLFDAAGYEPVIIETVGVGQVEVDVVAAADTAIVVVPPGSGDAVQASKAGLLEVADVFVVNTADRPGAGDVRRDLDLMLDLSHLTGQESPDGYRPPIVMASAIDGTGASDVLAAASAHLDHLTTTGKLAVRRRLRIRAEIKARMEQRLAAMTESVLSSPPGLDVLAEVESGAIPPAVASARLLAEVAEIAGGPL
jgi:LAO/AO transport system kinase